MGSPFGNLSSRTPRERMRQAMKKKIDIYKQKLNYQEDGSYNDPKSARGRMRAALVSKL